MLLHIKSTIRHELNNLKPDTEGSDPDPGKGKRIEWYDRLDGG